MVREIILKILQGHYKGLASIGMIDAIALFVLGWAYIERGDLPYAQWFHIFELEAFISGALVLLAILVMIWFLYPVEKKRAIYEI